MAHKVMNILGGTMKWNLKTILNRVIFQIIANHIAAIVVRGSAVPQKASNCLMRAPDTAAVQAGSAGKCLITPDTRT